MCQSTVDPATVAALARLSGLPLDTSGCQALAPLVALQRQAAAALDRWIPRDLEPACLVRPAPPKGGTPRG